MSDFPYQFTGKVILFDLGSMQFSAVLVPAKLAKELNLKEKRRLRIDGEINGFRFERALMPSKGKWHLMISKKMRKECDIAIGDKVMIEFEIADQDAVHVPRELQLALEANEAAMERWQSFTAGKRRSFCYWVDSAKRAETRERRVEEAIDRILEES